MESKIVVDTLRRLRRLRTSPAVRALVQETRVEADDLIAALFVHEKIGPPEAVASMPGVFRHSLAELVKECRALSGLGIRAIAIFPCVEPQRKDTTGSEALNRDALILRAIREIKRSLPELIVIADVALDPYTSHGHDGLLNESGTDVDNDRTVEALARMAVLQAEAGADWVAPSDMMDGRVRVIRRALDAAGFSQTAILSYAAKFASAFYGPFRDAIGSQRAAGSAYLDKRTYQLNPANAREAIQEALLDESEGADLLMVKPAGPYLDILHALRARTLLPLVAYQVSGEYAQIQAAARNGWLDLKKARDESLLAIKRAGADMIITYFARAMAEALRTRGS
ncbi:MAG: porphobilinogen synthase [Verrucomicrobia bacterium]|nr:porphobilinogen synthase [Verrucomicrobiota bacterium]